MSHSPLFLCSFTTIVYIYICTYSIYTSLELLHDDLSSSSSSPSSSSYTNTTTITIVVRQTCAYISISRCVSNVMRIIAVCMIEVIKRIKRKNSCSIEKKENRQTQAICKVLEVNHDFFTINIRAKNQHCLPKQKIFPSVPLILRVFSPFYRLH